MNKLKNNATLLNIFLIVYITNFQFLILSDYLSLESISYDLKDFLKTDYKSMDSAEIKGAFLNLLNKIIYDYERIMNDVGIPKIIIEKMKVRNNYTINLTIDLIEGICGSNFYDSANNYLKVYSILNIILSVLDNTISNSESTCDSINGQLSGLSFSEGGRTITEPKRK